MRCSNVREILDDHVDGVLPADAADRVRRHLDDCPECDQEMELLRAVTTPLSAWGDHEPPADCFERILERIEALPPHLRAPVPTKAPRAFHLLRGGARRIVAAGAVAAAMLVVAVAFDGPGTPADTRTRVRGESSDAARANVLRPHEIPLTRTHFVLTDEFEQRDGLRRRPLHATSDEHYGPAAPAALPVGLDPFGGSPR